MFIEQVSGHLRFLAKHRGAAAAERARRVMVAGLLMRGLAWRGERGRAARETARWLRSGRAEELLAP